MRYVIIPMSTNTIQVEKNRNKKTIFAKTCGFICVKG